MNVVATSLLTRWPDPQRGHRWPADPDTLTVLDTLDDYRHQAVVLHDEFDTDDPRFHRVDNRIPNAYFARWAHLATWLDDHPEVDLVWAVDGTDVELLHDPFPHMQPGRLYIGSEESTVGSPWMRATNPDHADWIAAHAHRPLLNPGLLGGDRATVARFATAVADRWPSADLTDMAAANAVAYEQHPDHVTGPTVHTPYKRDVRTSAWWKHK